jgi:hypothetical protein
MAELKFDIGFSASSALTEVGKLSTSVDDLGKGFLNVTRAASAHISSVTKSIEKLSAVTISASTLTGINGLKDSLSALAGVSDKLPNVTNAFNAIAKSTNALKVDANKAAYLVSISKSLAAFVTPLSKLGAIDGEKAATNITAILKSISNNSSYPSNSQISRLNKLAHALGYFATTAKSTAGIPSDFLSRFGLSGGTVGGTEDGGSRGSRGSASTSSSKDVPLSSLPRDEAGGLLLDPVYGPGGTVTGYKRRSGVPPSGIPHGELYPPKLPIEVPSASTPTPTSPSGPDPSSWGTKLAGFLKSPSTIPSGISGGLSGMAGSLGGIGKGAMSAIAGMSGPQAAAVYAMIGLLNDRSDVNEKLGSVMNFNLGTLGMGSNQARASMATQQMIDNNAMMHGISYRDSASVLTAYHKYSSGGLYNSGMAELGGPGVAPSDKVRTDTEAFTGNSRRLQRQLGIDLDEASGIQGSVRKNLQMNAGQFKEFGDSMVYLSRNTAMSKRDIIDLTKNVQTMGVITGKTGEEAKTFAQDLMTASGTLSQAGISQQAMNSIQKGFTGDMQSYLLNKQMGITSAMKPQEQIMAQKQFIESRLDSLSGMDPETRNVMIRMMQSKGLLPADMDLTDIYKEGRLDPAKFNALMEKHGKNIKSEQEVQGQSLVNSLGSAKNILLGGFASAASLDNPLGLGAVWKSLQNAAEGFNSLTGIGALFGKPTIWSGTPEKKAQGGIVGGKGGTDTTFALLTPGEEVLTKGDPRHSANFNPLDTLHSWAKMNGAFMTDPGNEYGGPRKGHSHAEGRAIDVRTRGKSQEEIASLIASAEAQGFKVISKTHGSGPHLHVEYTGKDVQAGSDTMLASKSKAEKVPDTMLASVEKAASAASGTLRNAGTSLMSGMGDIFNFTQNSAGNILKQTEDKNSAVTAALLSASTSSDESASKISEAADILLQAAQTMSSSVVAMASRGVSAAQQNQISNLARGNFGA